MCCTTSNSFATRNCPEPSSFLSKLNFAAGRGTFTSPISRETRSPPQHPFSNGRSFAAWLGLTPLSRSSGGKERLGRISKMGDRYIRRLLVLGMISRIKQIQQRPDQFDPWFEDILGRKPPKLAAVAMANKTARIIWAVLTREQDYQIRAA